MTNSWQNRRRQHRLRLLAHLAILLPTLLSCHYSSNKNHQQASRIFTNASANTPPHQGLAIHSAPKETNPSHIQVPVLCYHQVRDWTNNDSKGARTYILPVSHFKAQMHMLHDKGYHTILPDQFITYLKNGAKLPAKPILITFDDGTISQYDNALPVLNQYGYKAVFFIMTVTLNKKGYLNEQQIRSLAQQGHIIGCHTWDHHNVTQYKSADWNIQLAKPLVQLQHITGTPVKYFAYPFGAWDNQAIEQLKAHNMVAAFQLWGKTDEQYPLFTIKRILVDGNWDTGQLYHSIASNYTQ